MRFQEAVAELRAKFPNAALSPSVVQGESVNRAVRIDFKKGKNWMFAGRDGDGTEVMVYFNDNERVISCTEIEPYAE
ncbi:hypothetical protein [Limnoglobus roseus]|uniref:Uncharacterized protein n=1 Tax=Limnoglobus roseus TaxID=2598579 RepID=A0A5C1AHH6_9BACT|nr:hypothetical protein [Limnoglobus roseus]QEL18889.1 hypothetical protein PX52LOC_05933 [Limnoglobus roseus]